MKRGWTTAALGELCEITIGRTPSRAEPSYWDGPHPWLSIADMGSSAAIDRTKEGVTDDAAAKAAGRLVPAGTVVLSFKLSIGKVGVTARPMFTNEAIAALQPRTNNLDPGYLSYQLRNLDLAASANRAAMGGTLNKKTLAEIPLALPPLDEQRRIAALLDHVDALRTRRRQYVSESSKLLDSLFWSLFGDPLDPANPLPRKEIGSIGSILTGNSPSRSIAENFGEHIEWIKTDNIVPGQLQPTPAAERLSETGASKARIVPENSVLVACIAGSRSSIGRAALTDREVAFNQQINAIIPTEVAPRFLHAQLTIAPELVRSRSTGGMKGLVNKSSFSAIEILNPPRDAQDEFAIRAERLDRVRLAAVCHLAELDALFASLQARAFAGELDVDNVRLPST